MGKKKSREAQFEERMTDIRASIARAFDPDTPSHLVHAALPKEHDRDKLSRIAGRAVSMEEIFQAAGRTLEDVETLKRNAHLAEAQRALESLQSPHASDMESYYYKKLTEHLAAVYPDNLTEGLRSIGSSPEELHRIAANSEMQGNSQFASHIGIDFPPVKGPAPGMLKGPLTGPR